MKVKFTQAVKIGEVVYHPGIIADLKDKEAKQLIKDDKAIPVTEEVDNGSRSDSPQAQ